MRFVVAKRLSRRGEGLGNELVAWSKGFIASQVLDATLVGPAWGLNPRKYYRNFQTSRADVVLEEVLSRLPHYKFTEADYRASGETEFGGAIAKWASNLGLSKKSSFIVTVDGMYGGYPCIRTARHFLLSKLLGSRDALKNLHQIVASLDRRKLFIAVHMRSTLLGYSEITSGESVRGRFNFVVPGEWYLETCATLQRHFGDRAQFYFFTDKGGPSFEEAVRRFNPGQEKQSGLTECSDLLALAHADLRVCSVSSYSLASCFLSDGPYLWYENQLTVEDGFYSIWGAERAQQKEGSLHRQAMQYQQSLTPGQRSNLPYHGVPMAAGDPLPESLLAQLEATLAGRDRRTNLMEYGIVPLALRS